MVDLPFYSLFPFYRKGIFLSLLIQTESYCLLSLFPLYIHPFYLTITIQNCKSVLITLLITLLYHYIFFKHSLCIAIHLSIISPLPLHNKCMQLLYVDTPVYSSPYHYILINTKCHITDSCITISPLSLYIN